MKLAVIVGSLRHSSHNLTLARVLVERLPADTETTWVDLRDVPFMNEDLEANVPSSVVRVADQVLQSDGVLIVSPEYNRGIPAVTKNIIDWLSRGSTGNVLRAKPVAIGGISTGPIKTLVMQSQLRPVLAHVGAVVLTSPVLALSVGEDNMTAEGVVSEKTSLHFDEFTRALLAHVSLYSEAQR
ncbi:MAG: hypothetical protein UY35_C0012G0026 [Candidatus Saccharibacteria bacterium GW2011_GWC2_48_9]|nr:MAG: hypothetical protein UY35_C0012G0026 [Candidatus Saccharibacteria bacterium GW2011_GWC2_48_9]